MDTWFDKLTEWFLNAALGVCMILAVFMTIGFVAESIHDYQHKCSCVIGHYHTELVFNAALKMAMPQEIWHCEEKQCLK